MFSISVFILIVAALIKAAAIKSLSQKFKMPCHGAI